MSRCRQGVQHALFAATLVGTLVGTLAASVATTVAAQAPKKTKADSAKKPKAAKTPKAADASVNATANAPANVPTNVPKDPDSRLFRSEEVVAVTFTTNLKALRKDKGDQAPWHAATVSYSDSSAPNGQRVVPVRARTRGIWRLRNCEFPPVRLNFVNKDTKGTLFRDLDEPKLVSYCRATNMYEQYVLQEYQLYRIYRALTPASHRVRLLRMSYADSATGKVDQTRYAFIVEDPTHVAMANGGKIVKLKGADTDDLDPMASTVAFLFNFMIGNTDFSVTGLHNAELIGLAMGIHLPIAYDFDFAGAINATYATPDPSLPIKRVRDRLYRGPCAFNAQLPDAIKKFEAQKAAIYALYTDKIGALLEPSVVKQTLAYFDDFYAILAKPKDTEKYIIRDCRPMT
jgi:hypothetical protein